MRYYSDKTPVIPFTLQNTAIPHKLWGYIYEKQYNWQICSYPKGNYDLGDPLYGEQGGPASRV
jgi:hypothetical protein